MEIIYRVYEAQREEGNICNYTTNGDVILDQAVLCCNSREHFKEIMRDMYAPQKVSFRNSSKLKDGDIYVVIISEDCWNSKRYIEVSDFVCDCCGKNFKRNEDFVSRLRTDWIKPICPQRYENDEKKFMSMRFCSYQCRDKVQKEIENDYRQFAKENNILSDEWISREDFNSDFGYIYMISKKSTGEFYVGQTKYVPVFRWGQHLKTERFKIEEIEDYKFEVLEVCKNNSETLNQREAHWINKKRNENPKLSLNIQIPMEKRATIFDIMEQEEEDETTNL